MKHLFIVVFIFTLCSCTTVQTKNIPVENFFKNSKKTNFKISPDGKMISYLAPWKNRLNLFIASIENIDHPMQITSIEDQDLFSYFWKNSKTIIFSRDFLGDENHQYFKIDITSHQTLPLTPYPGVKAMIIDSLYQIDDQHMLLGLNQRNRKFFDVYKINIESGAKKLVVKNPGNITDWFTDHDGIIRAAIATNGTKKSILTRASENKPFKILLTTDYKEIATPLFFTFDNKNIYASSNRGRDKNAIVVLNLKAGTEKVLYHHPEVDVHHLSFSNLRKVLLYSRYTTKKNYFYFYDEEFKKIFNRLQKHFKDSKINIVDYDDQENHFIIYEYSDTIHGIYYFYNKNTHSFIKLSDTKPWLNPDQMSKMEPIEYRSRDGLKINGYLTIPKGSHAKDLPVVIHPHGGPWLRDYWGFNAEVQFLASRGYAVLQMNYRGSTGYGRKFWEASFKQWGKKMQDDITDGVQWLIQNKIADQKRIAIYGNSYGGYAALAGLAFTPDLYACGIDYVGPSNLFTLIESVPPYWKPQLKMFYEQVGHPKKDYELLREISPFFHVDKIKAPLFVAQGANDPRVNIRESDQIVDALRKRGMEVYYMVKENEGHGFMNEENKFDFYKQMEKFLEKCMDK